MERHLWVAGALRFEPPPGTDGARGADGRRGTPSRAVGRRGEREADVRGSQRRAAGGGARAGGAALVAFLGGDPTSL